MPVNDELTTIVLDRLNTRMIRAIGLRRCLLVLYRASRRMRHRMRHGMRQLAQDEACKDQKNHGPALKSKVSHTETISRKLIVGTPGCASAERLHDRCMRARIALLEQPPAEAA